MGDIKNNSTHDLSSGPGDLFVASSVVCPATVDLLPQPRQSYIGV